MKRWQAVRDFNFTDVFKRYDWRRAVISLGDIIYQSENGDRIVVGGASYYLKDVDDILTANCTQLSSISENLLMDTGAAASGSVINYPQSVYFTILGDEDTGTHVHFQIQIDDIGSFASPLVDVESKSSQTNWFYSDGSAWQAQPAGGVVADFTYIQDGYGIWILTPTNYTNNGARYDIPSGLAINTQYFVRMRQWDVEGAAYGNWVLLSPFIL